MWCLFRFVLLLLSVICLVRTDCPGLVSRNTWDALKPVRVRYVIRPVNIVIIQHSVTPSCDSDDTCEAMMRSMQNYHMDQLGFWDIASSFYVGGNGKIYVGTGWLHEGAHTIGYNDKSIGISFIGNYNNLAPTKAQLRAVKDLLRCGVEEGHLSQGYHVVGHRQLITTESPGRKLYNEIRSWPEWLEDVSSIRN